MGILMQPAMTLAIKTAPVVIVVRGVSEGLQEGLSGGLMVGQIAWKGIYHDD
jgi:hypothetical protein